MLSDAGFSGYASLIATSQAMVREQAGRWCSGSWKRRRRGGNPIWRVIRRQATCADQAGQSGDDGRAAGLWAGGAAERMGLWSPAMRWTGGIGVMTDARAGRNSSRPWCRRGCIRRIWIIHKAYTLQFVRHKAAK